MAGDLAIRSLLERYRDASTDHPLLVLNKGVIVGNSGDWLMVMGTYRMDRDLGFRPIDEPIQAYPGKPKFVFERPYHKNCSIYVLSLASRPGMAFVPLSEQGLS